MRNPVYYRLLKDGHFVGFKRIVTEFLPAAYSKWQLEPLEHDPEDTQTLSKPAMGIVTLKRERIIAVIKKAKKEEPQTQNGTVEDKNQEPAELKF